MIRVLFFARVRDQAGVAQIEFELPAEVSCLRDLTETLKRSDPRYQEALSANDIIVALNQEVADSTSPVGDGDEVAYYPPVTGG